MSSNVLNMVTTWNMPEKPDHGVTLTPGIAKLTLLAAGMLAPPSRLKSTDGPRRTPTSTGSGVSACVELKPKYGADGA